MKPRSLSVVASILFAFSLFASVHAVSAQDLVPGLSVSPAQLEYTVSANDTLATHTVTVTNGYAVPISLDATFKGIDQTAGILAPTDTLDTTLARSLRVSPSTIILPAHGSTQLTAQVLNTTSLPPGGQYATLVLTQQQAGSKQLALRSSISLSMFIVKTDGARARIRLDQPHINGWLLQLPTKAVFTVTNTGNVHTVPRGIVQIDDQGNTLVAQGIINQSSLPLLPSKSLQTVVPIAQVKHVWKPGRVTIVTQYRADGASDTQSIQTSRLYVPALYPGLFILILAFFGGLFLRRRNKRSRVIPASMPSEHTTEEIAQHIPHVDLVSPPAERTNEPKDTPSHEPTSISIPIHEAVAASSEKPLPKQSKKVAKKRTAPAVSTTAKKTTRTKPRAAVKKRPAKPPVRPE